MQKKQDTTSSTKRNDNLQISGSRQQYSTYDNSLLDKVIPFTLGSQLPQTLGNQSLQNLLRSGRVQPKLKVSQPGDSLEQEADRMAQKIMHTNMSQPTGSIGQEKTNINNGITNQLNRKCESCKRKSENLEKQEKNDLVSRQSSNISSSSITNESKIPGNTVNYGNDGSQLDISTRRFMEPRFGYDFSNVVIHTDNQSSDSAKELNSSAYTIGNHIVMDKTQYSPDTFSGNRLIAHELAHVIQQRDAGSSQMIQRAPPAAAGAVKGIEVITALLAAASVASSAYQGGKGGLSYTSDAADRLSEKSQPKTNSYQATCLGVTRTHPMLPNIRAKFEILWDGNHFGEIGAARVRADLENTTQFSTSELKVSFRALKNLMQPGADKRWWEIQWDYEGSFDPAGGGNYWFQGSFAINAFGWFTPLKHVVKDFGWGWGGGPASNYVWPGQAERPVVVIPIEPEEITPPTPTTPPTPPTKSPAKGKQPKKK